MKVTLTAALATIALLAGCEHLQGLQQKPPPPAPPPTVSIVALYQQPAERALINGLRLYEDGAFDRAEPQFRSALQQVLRDRRDAATAHKYLAFIACAFNRIGDCEASFRNAFATDPQFTLTDAEIGHPIWGPVFRRVRGK
jgi:hypothetical protein